MMLIYYQYCFEPMIVISPKSLVQPNPCLYIAAMKQPSLVINNTNLRTFVFSMF